MDIDVDEITSTSKESLKFDSIIGHIEDIIISEDFQNMQDTFMEKYYKEFDDSEENKFIYTDIFKEYTATIEKCLNDELKKRISDFSMEMFVSTLQAHKNEITGDIFDMLLSFSDFISFKEMFLDYKAEKEGRNMDINDGFVIRSLAPATSSQVRGDGPDNANSVPMTLT
ncbi:ADP-ribosylation factor-like protein 2-binding protein [Styela clava]|uniref:ADP-ribosylation factor-like protein 2-binding protein n=1 Tax=Styela clava TaxID=7725 RepID=UPI00193A7194|nr:ADP-ribosylation factor-like protein 2-binding protein [Styela clava]